MSCFSTTTILLIYGLYELALNPDVQVKLYEQVRDAHEAGGGQIDYDVMNQLNYLDMFVSGKIPS
jgi:cytochrome P450